MLTRVPALPTAYSPPCPAVSVLTAHACGMISQASARLQEILREIEIEREGLHKNRELIRSAPTDLLANLVAIQDGHLGRLDQLTRERMELECLAGADVFGFSARPCSCSSISCAAWDAGGVDAKRLAKDILANVVNMLDARRGSRAAGSSGVAASPK